jgi:hypothetical protein
MKTIKTILFCFLCFLVFLITGTATCALRAKYKYVPKVRASLAYSYAAFFSEYALLQSTQVGGQQGKTALLEYLGILQRVQNEKIQYPERMLHLYSEITYIRLYRLEAATNNPTKAEEYLRSAENELAILGHKDVTRERLIQYIQAQGASESKLYNSSTDQIGDGSETNTSEPASVRP